MTKSRGNWFYSFFGFSGLAVNAEPIIPFPPSERNNNKKYFTYKYLFFYFCPLFGLQKFTSSPGIDLTKCNKGYSENFIDCYAGFYFLFKGSYPLNEMGVGMLFVSRIRASK